ncbi:phosphopantothenoylcysteine decarboxylase / phosphopantothenate--cysteine ligase [Lachnospiraceae bacterium]|nr:phosphopantothenoylcysteine decarboxylase / phosphopantothenate--cysteine ligase [Lachnospiraceae bacterium]
MKNLLLVVSGSIAAYKAADLSHMFVKAGVNVNVLMTANAANFINPITFESLTHNKCIIDTFDRNFEFKIGHISLAQSSDAVLVAPASANIIGKIANGIADDMATTTIMACKCPIYIAPAMNTNMFQNPIMQDNLKKLERFGYHIIQPASGLLACGDVGAGKLPPIEDLYETLMLELSHDHDMTGKKVLITAGPTEEAMDPVRFITNHSTGKMGYALARSAARRGADVTLVSGPVSLKAPLGVNTVPVTSAADMAREVMERANETDIFVLAAAVADYRPANIAAEKIKKKAGADNEELSLPLVRTQDILNWLGHNRHGDEVICGFAMETENLLENARSKLTRKNADLICANSLRAPGAGFGTDTNRITIITADEEKELDIMSKDDVSDAIFDQILSMRK